MKASPKFIPTPIVLLCAWLAAAVSPWPAAAAATGRDPFVAACVTLPQITVIETPNSVALEDLDGDGDDDVVYAGDAAIHVCLSNGDGTFAAETAYGTGDDYVECDDVNGDEIPDLTYLAFGHAFVHYGRGDGTFDDGRSMGGVIEAYFFEIGDLNDDGLADLIEGNLVQVQIRFGLGGGSFGGEYFPDVLFAHPYSAETTDLDGDGRNDLIMNYYNNTNRRFLTNPDGTLGASLLVEGYDVDYAVGDVDADGDVDFVFASNPAKVFLNDGDGAFAAGPTVSTYIRTLELADFTGDGRLDIVGIGDGLFVLPGLGDGSFAPAPGNYCANVSALAATGDVDADGRVDVVVANIDASVSLLLNANSPVDAGSGANGVLASRVYPNPVRGQVTIESAPTTESGPLDVRIYDSAGRMVRRLTSSAALSGARRVAWDGRDTRGADVPAGVYFYRLQVAGREASHRVVHLR